MKQCQHILCIDTTRGAIYICIYCRHCVHDICAFYYFFSRTNIKWCIFFLRNMGNKAWQMYNYWQCTSAALNMKQDTNHTRTLFLSTKVPWLRSWIHSETAHSARRKKNPYLNTTQKNDLPRDGSYKNIEKGKHTHISQGTSSKKKTWCNKGHCIWS